MNNYDAKTQRIQTAALKAWRKNERINQLRQMQQAKLAEQLKNDKKESE